MLVQVMRWWLYFLPVLAVVREVPATKERPPNIVLIIADDLGYGDLGCFGNTTIRTPHIDKLATQGIKLMHNVAADTMCTPSRAAFLTGRYPIRSGMASSHAIRAFMFTASAAGLPANETTIGEVAKKAGYETAFLGKWHQGWSTDRSDPEHHHPLNQGFDYFYGIPLTNMPDFDEPSNPVLLHIFPHVPFQLMTTFLLTFITVWCLVRAGYLHIFWAVLLLLMTGLICSSILIMIFKMTLLNSFMFRNYELVEQPVHLGSVTQKLVAEGNEFLQARHKDRAPFLLLMSWLHVHSALATAPQFTGHSQYGRYGDAVEEMDWGVGQLMESLDHFEMTDNTLVYFTSDHGAAPGAKDLTGRTVGGFNGPFKGAKTDGSTEGSFRVPGIFRWPGHIAAGEALSEPVSMMDVLPTIAELLHVPVSSDTAFTPVIDGASLVPLLTGTESISPHTFLFHYCQDQVHAVRYRPRSGSAVWKLQLREPDPGIKNLIGRCDGAFALHPPKLFDLSTDPTASVPVDPQQYSSVISTILQALEKHQQSITLVPSQFTFWRLMLMPWAQPCCQFPKCTCEDTKFKGIFLD